MTRMHTALARIKSASRLSLVPLVPFLCLRVTIREVKNGGLRKRTSLDWINEELSKRPDDVGLLYSKGAYLAKTGEHKDAIDCFERITHLDPDHTKGWTAKAKAYFRIGEYEKSIESFDVLIDKNPESEKLWYEKGESLLKLGKFREANLCYDKAIELDQNYADAWCGKGNALKGLGKESPSGIGEGESDMWTKDDMFEGAFECFSKVLALNPQHHRARGSRGVLLCEMGNHEDGLRDIDRAVEGNPNLLEPLLEKARVLESKGLERDSHKIRERVLVPPDGEQAIEDIDELLWRSKAGMEIAQYEQAIQILDRVLAINPNHVRALLAKGDALSKLGSKEEALVYYDQALSHRPEMGEVWLLKGDIQRELGMVEESLLDYEQATSVSPSSTDAWFQRSMTLYSASKLRDALRSLLHVLRLDPSHPGAIGMKDKIESRLFDDIEALRRRTSKPESPDRLSFLQAATASPQYGESTHDELVNRGIRLFSQERYHEALTCFDGALSIDNSEYTVWEWKGDSLVKLNRYSEAIECYDHAVKLKHRRKEEDSASGEGAGERVRTGESDSLAFDNRGGPTTAEDSDAGQSHESARTENMAPTSPETEFLIDKQDWLILNSLLDTPKTVQEICAILQEEAATVFPRIEGLYKQGLLERRRPLLTLARGERRINLYLTNRTTYELLRI